MLNAEKIKKRFYISLVFYILFGTIIYFWFDEVASPAFTHKYKTILFVIKLVYMNLPIVLALVLNNYINKKYKNIEK